MQRYNNELRAGKMRTEIKAGKERTAKLARKAGLKKAGLAAAGVAAAGGAVYGGKKLADHIKAKRAAKAKEVAVEEGVSLDEAFEYVLECEQYLLNEGYEFEDIYDEDYDMEEVYDEVGMKYEGPTPESRAKAQAQMQRYNNELRAGKMRTEIKAGKERTAKLARKAGLKKAGLAAAGAAALGGAAYGVNKAIKARRAKKAAEVAVEEGVSLDEAMMWVLECEQEYLNEGYDFIDIYGDWE